MKAYNLQQALAQPQQVKALFLNHQALQELPKAIAELSVLETLDLSHNRLSTLPDWLLHLTQLQNLVLSQNVFHTLPEFLCQMGELKLLDVSLNHLESLPQNIGNLQKLEELQLSKNKLLEFPESIGNLGRLKVLNLTHNGIRRLPKNIIQAQALTQLLLSHNQLQRLPKKLGQLLNLENLLVQGNHLSQLPDSLGELSQLRQLDVSENRLRSLPATIGRCRMLRQLKTSGNKLSKLPDAIGQLKWLARLDLRKNRLSRLPKTIGQCIQLRELFLQKNQLARLPESMVELERLFLLDISHNQLQQLPTLPQRLEQLLLHHNQLDQWPKELSDVAWLKQLDISGNPIQEIPESVARLSKLQKLNASNTPIRYFQRKLLLLDQLSYAKGALPGKAQKRYFSFVKGCLQQQIQGADRLRLYAILDGVTEEPPSLKELFQLLHLRLPEARLRARALLFAETPPPLRTGDHLSLLGRSHFDFAILKQSLKSYGIGLSKKLSPETTHLLISQSPPYSDLLDQNPWPRWSEQQLVRWIDQHPERHIAQNATLEQLTHLRQLLYHSDTKHALLALQLLVGGGVPKALLTDLYIVQATTNNSALKKGLRKLLALYLEDKTWAIMQWPVVFSWKPRNRKRFQGYLEKLCRSGEIDQGKVVEFLSANYSK